MYCITDPELHPGALFHSMPLRRQYLTSKWSKPMVAVAMNDTLVPSSRLRLQIVRVLIIRASASSTSFRRIDFPAMYETSATLSGIPLKKGIASSMTTVNPGRFFMQVNSGIAPLSNITIFWQIEES